MADGRDKGWPGQGQSRADVDRASNARVHSLLSDLDATFDSAVAREEEAAAFDLAVSLDNDRTLADVIARTTTTVGSAGTATGRSQVLSCGRDFITVDAPGTPHLDPMSCIFRLEKGTARPRHTGVSLLEVLREWARAGADITLSTPFGDISGVLRRARRDHVELETIAGSYLVPHGLIRGVRLNRGD